MSDVSADSAIGSFMVYILRPLKEPCRECGKFATFTIATTNFTAHVCDRHFVLLAHELNLITRASRWTQKNPV